MEIKIFLEKLKQGKKKHYYRLQDNVCGITTRRKWKVTEKNGNGIKSFSYFPSSSCFQRENLYLGRHFHIISDSSSILQYTDIHYRLGASPQPKHSSFNTLSTFCLHPPREPSISRRRLHTMIRNFSLWS